MNSCSRYTGWWILVCVAASWAQRGWAAEPQVGLRVVKSETGSAVQVTVDDHVLLTSPPEGLWTVGLGWRDGWPERWVHAQVETTDHEAEWTIVRGTLQLENGSWVLEDAYRREGQVIHGRRRWTWTGTETLAEVTLTVRFQVQALPKPEVLLPGIIYYGNPSGARSGRVPVLRGEPEELAFFEEHRYPMPFAYVEALTPQQQRYGVSLHAVPTPTPYAHRADQWWSLGVRMLAHGTELALLSGPCAMNGRKSVIKGSRRELVPYDQAYLNVVPGAVIEKHFYLYGFPVTRPNFGFTRAVDFELQRWAPFDPDAFPPIGDILRAKYRAAKARFIRREAASGFSLFPVAGFQKYPPRARRQAIVMGWTGQAEAPAYALLALEDWLADPDIPRMVQDSLDFLVTSPINDRGFHVWYDLTKHSWEGQDFVSQGQAMHNIARAVELADRRGWDTRRWKAFLQRVAEVHTRRILDPQWSPEETSEATLVAPLFRCARMFHEPRYADAARKVALEMGRRHAGTTTPYWGGTLDARCEDKEAAAAALQAFLALWDHTRDPEHLQWAEHAAYIVLTYTYLWNVDMPPGRLRDHALKTQGWTLVSPQNQHLDVWGTIIAPDLYRLGQLCQRPDWTRLALVMYRSCGQMIDPWGSQGEQLNHTNWLPDWNPNLKTLGRGTYNETWTPFWITAHFLTGAADLRALGVAFDGVRANQP